MTRGIRPGGTLLALVLCSTLAAASSAQGDTTVLNGTVDTAGTAFKSHKITIGAAGAITAKEPPQWLPGRNNPSISAKPLG
jgi:hypothetical protein